MNITRIFSSQIQPNNIRKTNNSYIKLNDLYQDKFEKNANLSFRGKNPDFQEKIDLASNMLEEHIMNEDFSLGKIENIARKVSPEINVQKYKLSNSANATSQTIGYLEAPIAFTVDGRAILQSKTLKITPPRDNSKAEKLRVLKNTVHELTHALQFDEPDKSKTEFFNKYLAKNSIQNPETLNSIQGCAKVASAIEANIQQPLLISLQKTDNMPVEVSGFSSKELNKMFIETTGLSTEDFIKQVAVRVIGTYAVQTGGMNNIDIKFLLKYTDLLAKTEKEAYEQDIRAAKKVLGIDQKTDMDYIPMLYEKLSETIKTIV